MSTIYVSPTGSGTGSGLSVGSALSVNQLNKAIQLAGPGGTVMMLADQGAYNISGSIALSSGGSGEAPVTILGVDSAGHPQNIVINGTRPADYSATNPVGNEIFKLFAGADNLVFQNMTFNNVSLAFRACADLSNITIEHMTADNIRHFFEDYASGTATTASISGLTIQDVDVHGFSKDVIRLQYDTHDVVINNVYGDSQHEDGDGIAMGIHLEGTVHHVTITNSTMENAVGTNSSYWNGDGFATERGVYDVTFQNCVARGNADGGFDIKSNATTLVDCVAENNAHNFRLWGEATLINPTGLEPHKYGGTGGQYQIQILNGAKVTVTGGHFSDSSSATVVVVNDGGTSITFNGTDFVHAADGKMTEGSAIYGLDPAFIHTLLANGTLPTEGAPVVAPLAAVTLNGTAAADVLTASSDSHYTVNGLAGNDTITTHGGNDTITGGGGDDSISAGDGNDLIQFFGTGSGFDTVSGGAGSDTIAATAQGTVIGLHSLDGVEAISAGGFAGVTIMGSSAADTFDFTNVALTGIDRIGGGAGNDSITGSAAQDVLSGDSGADHLAGGGGSDLFSYSNASDSRVRGADTIVDFTVGADKIDLSGIDASTRLSGNQAFTFIGSGAFTGAAGQLRADTSDPNVTHIYGDINGDRHADFQIDVLGNQSLHAGDFIL